MEFHAEEVSFNSGPESHKAKLQAERCGIYKFDTIVDAGYMNDGVRDVKAKAKSKATHRFAQSGNKPRCNKT